MCENSKSIATHTHTHMRAFGDNGNQLKVTKLPQYKCNCRTVRQQYEQQCIVIVVVLGGVGAGAAAVVVLLQSLTHSHRLISH